MPQQLNIPNEEQQRLLALQSTRLLDSGSSERFDRITRLASDLLNTPVAIISLVDADRQWFKSVVGLEIRETERRFAFCDVTIKSSNVTVIPNTENDPRFTANPYISGAQPIKSYAGAPLTLPSGHAIGSLCVIDHKARMFTDKEQRQLQDLASLVMSEINAQSSAGRWDEVTKLPNGAQLSLDLEDLCVLYPGRRRVFVLLEVMTHGEIQDASRAVGVKPVDELIFEVGSRMQKRIEKSALIYSVGAARLGFLLSEGTAGDEAYFIKELLDAMREPISSAGSFIALQMRAGLVEFDLIAQQTADVVRKATSAVYEAFERGSSILAYDPSVDAEHIRSYSIIRDFPRAISQSELSLVYQPKYDVTLKKYESVEALIRWNHPTLGNISPAQFVALIERTDLIHRLTRWVLHTALSQLAEWRDDGLDIAIAINVSAKNLDDPAFADVLQDACDAYSIPYERLHLECTENAILTKAATRKALERIRLLGFQISLDDFGVGYCNLSCLANLPVQTIKLDQSLVKPIAGDANAHAVADAIIHLAHQLGYKVVAEGVETDDVFDELVAMGCDAIQGYLLSRPLTATDARNFFFQ